MNLIINGESVCFSNDIRTVQCLLNYLKIEEKWPIVELNQEILEKSMYAKKRLTDQDKIEIVHFVGGG